MSQPAFRFLAACLVAGGVVAAKAVVAPDNVEEELAFAVQSCRNFEGTPNADAVLSVADVNEDGGEDWIADYSKLDCAGGVNPMCSPDGCDLQIFLWNGAMAWPLRFEETVQSYKFGKRDGRPVLDVVMAGAACDKPAGETCRVTYRLEEDDVVPIP